MNKHIELVEKWLSDKESVSAEELRANAADATYAAYGADHASYDAAHAAYEAAYWVNKYKELTK